MLLSADGLGLRLSGDGQGARGCALHRRADEERSLLASCPGLTTSLFGGVLFDLLITHSLQPDTTSLPSFMSVYKSIARDEPRRDRWFMASTHALPAPALRRLSTTASAWFISRNGD